MNEASPTNPQVDGPAGESRVRFQVLAWLCVAATIAYICRNSIAVAESTIREDIGLSEKAMGLVISAFFLPYAVAQIPTGWLGDLWGSRRALPVAAWGWSLATAMMGLAWGMPMLIVSRVLNGTMQAGLFPCCTNTVARWFPPTQRAFASGALASFMSVGGAIGAALTGVLIYPLGWRWMFVAYSGLGCLWGLGFYWWFRELPEEHASVTAAELQRIRGREPLAKTSAQAGHPRVPTPWLAIFSSPAMWWICGQQFFRAAGHMFFASWFATYLQQTRDVSIKESGTLTMLPLLAVVVGSLMGGVASDWVLVRTGSRRLARQGVAIVALLACATLTFVAFFIENALLAVSVISAGTFCFAIGGPTAYTITIDMGDRHVATVFSTMNMSGNIGAAIFPYIVPWFREVTGSWDGVLLLFGGMFVAAAACWLLLNPRGTIFDQSLIPAAEYQSPDGSR